MPSQCIGQDIVIYATERVFIPDDVFPVIALPDSDFLSSLTRKRKVDSQVVEAVTQELLHDLLAEIGELQQRVNGKLGRDDLSASNIKVALEQIISFPS